MSAAIDNRPGLSQLAYRIGTFGSFLAAMKGRLGSADYPELSDLTTRDSSDPSIALLDAWAIVADVLTFYQERMANEGFLRTATERRSVFELASLVGFKPRPGVAASVYLAYGLEKDARLTIKKGRRSQSSPGDGELPQTYETSQDLVARAEWNNLAPRLTIPQKIDAGTTTLYFKGANLGLKPNDPLLFVTRSKDLTKPEDQPRQTLPLVRIQSVEASFERGTTKVVLQPDPIEASKSKTPGIPKNGTFAETVLEGGATSWQADIWRVSTAHASPGVALTSPLGDSALPEVLAEFDPRLSLDQLNAASARAEVSEPPDTDVTDVYAFRVHTAPFGHNAPKRPVFGVSPPPQGEANLGKAHFIESPGLIGYTEWTLGTDGGPLTNAMIDQEKNRIGLEASKSITLDSAHETIVPGSWTVIVRPMTTMARDGQVSLVRDPSPETGPKPEGVKEPSEITVIQKVRAVDGVSRADYGVTAPVTRLALSEGWLTNELKLLDSAARAPGAAGLLDSSATSTLSLELIRNTIVYAQSERLELAEQPFTEPVWKATIELDGLYDGLDEGRWLIVEGERADLLEEVETIQTRVDENEKSGAAVEVQSSGVWTAELVRLSSVERAPHKPGLADTMHSHVTVSPALAHVYKRDTVAIHGNVVLATHGDARSEVLGSGDATKPYQTFALRQGPLTFVPSPTVSGASSSLELRVNDIKWDEVESLVGAKADDRVFVAELDDKGGARIVFGDGWHGTRVPTGIENVKAQYRVGIGAAGNVGAARVTQLLDRPPGAKDVRNPLPAAGGADPDTPDQARDIAPLSVEGARSPGLLDRLQGLRTALCGDRQGDRLARMGWHAAEDRRDCRSGAGDLPIKESKLHDSLVAAMQQFGDPSRVVDVIDFERHLLVLEAGVRLQPNYVFESVKPKLRWALLDAFGFEKRRLGDDLALSQVLEVMHSVEGVHSVDVDVFATISGEDIKRMSAADVKDADTVKGKPKTPSSKKLPAERLPILRGVAGEPPAQRKPANAGWLVYASPRVPGTLRFEEIP